MDDILWGKINFQQRIGSFMTTKSTIQNYEKNLHYTVDKFKSWLDTVEDKISEYEDINGKFSKYSTAPTEQSMSEKQDSVKGISDCILGRQETGAKQHLKIELMAKSSIN